VVCGRRSGQEPHRRVRERDKLKVNYENFPWAQYRTSVVTRLVGNAPMDVMWISDAWLPEFAEAQWLASIDDVPELMKVQRRCGVPIARSR
jgi:ABC-type glycerol-3-phosphate transport system substrate-binding protein